MSKQEKNVGIDEEDSPKPKRVALLIDSIDNLLRAKEGIKLLYEAKIQGVIIWNSSYICDIRKDPKGLDDISQECTQINIDILIFVSGGDYAEIILGNLGHKYGNKKTYVVSVTAEQSILNSTQIFQDVISGNLPEMEYVEFEKAERLAPYEIMKLLPS